MAALLPMLPLAGCSSAPATPPTPIEMRVRIKTGPQTAALDDAALTQYVAEQSQLATRHLSSSGAGWHAMVLICREASQCEAGLARLQARPDEFALVQLDSRATRGPGIVTPAASR